MWWLFYGLLVVVGGSLAVYHVADRAGRSGALWLVVAMVLSTTASFLSYLWLVRRALEAASPDLGSVPIAVVMVAPILVHGGLMVAAIRLPAPAGNTRKQSFAMRTLGGDGDGTCTLILGRRSLIIEPAGAGAATEVRYADLEASAADQETLRLRWNRGGEVGSAQLLLVDGPRVREGRVRAIAALSARIGRLRLDR